MGVVGVAGRGNAVAVEEKESGSDARSVLWIVVVVVWIDECGLEWR